MTDSKISAFSDGTAPAGSDEIPAARAGANIKLTWTEMLTAVKAVTLDLFAPPAAAVAMNAKKITGIAAATAATDAASLANRLDQFAVPTASVAMNSQKLTGLAAGAAAGESVRYEQLAMVQLYDSVLGANAASFDITPISQAFNHLRILFTLRNDDPTGLSIVNARFNNDSGANYDLQKQVGNNGSAAAAVAVGQTSFAQVAYVPGSGADAGNFSSGQMDIPNYCGGSTAMRTLTCISGALPKTSDQTIWATKNVFGLWHSTAAITRITIIPGGGASNFVAGSRVTVYGLL